MFLAPGSTKALMLSGPLGEFFQPEGPSLLVVCCPAGSWKYEEKESSGRRQKYRTVRLGIIVHGVSIILRNHLDALVERYAASNHPGEKDGRRSSLTLESE